MFTGLIEATGTIAKITKLGDQSRYEINIPFAAELALGDSVAINGCCLTVASLSETTATFDLLHQTLKTTSLGSLDMNSTVNLERALLASQRLGGHFVQGHVDATGSLITLSKHGQDHRLEIALPKEVHHYCIAKGSIAIDGMSLTIAELGETSATFWITPHTFQETNLSTLQPNAKINLEIDLLAKYTEKLLATRSPLA